MNVINPDYPKQARDVIDELGAELREVCDMIRVEQTVHQLIQHEDRVVDIKIRVELGKWKVRFTVSAIMNLIFLVWMTWCWGY